MKNQIEIVVTILLVIAVAALAVGELRIEQALKNIPVYRPFREMSFPTPTVLATPSATLSPVKGREVLVTVTPVPTVKPTKELLK
jgi:hypothetical protein